MELITACILHSYHSFGGDIAAYKLQQGDHTTGSGEAWQAIEAALGDIGKINLRQCSDIYTAGIIKHLRSICDAASFDHLSSTIYCYRGFQSVATELHRILYRVNASTNTTCADFDTPAVFLCELKADIFNIRHCSFNTLEKIKIEFAPISTYQQLSICNGWNDEYMEMAHRFDILYNELNTLRTAFTTPVRKPSRKWWKFL